MNLRYIDVGKRFDELCEGYFTKTAKDLHRQYQACFETNDTIVA